MIRPSAESELYVKAEGLQPFSRWLRLTNENTCVLGPSDVAAINGKMTKDRVPEAQRRIMAKHSDLFANEVPLLSLLDYSIHYGQFHTSFTGKDIEANMDAYLANPSCPGTV